MSSPKVNGGLIFFAKNFFLEDKFLAEEIEKNFTKNMKTLKNTKYICKISKKYVKK